MPVPSQTTSPDSPAVELRNVSFSYASRQILNGVNLTFNTCELNALIGPNGCGKSTTVKLITNLLKPAAGEILVEGSSTISLPRKELARRVAVLAQGAETPDMLVEHLVMSGRYPHRGALVPPSALDKTIVTESMERAGCLEFAGESMRNLSGGERQRVYLALVLAQQTNIVIMDEPTAFLDASACFDLMNLARDLTNSGKTVIMVLHDLNLALSYCDRIAVLKSGSIKAFGTPHEVAASGTIEDVFGVRLRSVQDVNSGTDYYCLLPAL